MAITKANPMKAKLKDQNNLLYGVMVSDEKMHNRRPMTVVLNERWTYMSSSYNRKDRTLTLTLTQGTAKVVFPTDVEDVVFRQREKDHVYFDLILP